MNNKLLNIALSGILIILFQSGCNQRITRSTSGTYHLQGAVVKNKDNDSIQVSILLTKNDTLADSVNIMIGSDTLKFEGGLYRKSYNTTGALAAGDRQIRISDRDFSDSIIFTIPSDLNISSISLPESRINPGGAAVPIEWTAASGSNGYSIGVAKNSLAYKSDGFCQFVATGGNLISIPPDAFRLSGNLDTGWYKVFVYAYAGSPTDGQDLPTKFPSGLSDNISKLDISGSFGAIVVSKPDSIHVTLE